MSASARRRTTHDGEMHAYTPRRGSCDHVRLGCPATGWDLQFPADRTKSRADTQGATARGRSRCHGGFVGVAGFEPAASCSQSMRANQAAPHPVDQTKDRTLGMSVRPRPRRLYSCLRRLQESRGHSKSLVPRGRSSMVELQPSKLVMRVRFSSPAPPPPPGGDPEPPDHLRSPPGGARKRTAAMRTRSAYAFPSPRPARAGPLSELPHSVRVKASATGRTSSGVPFPGGGTPVAKGSSATGVTGSPSPHERTWETPRR